MKNPPRTICANCAFGFVDLKNLGKENIYKNRLNFRCRAVIHDEVIDPVTGVKTFVTHEARFITEEKHPNCIDMNPNGECPMYEKANT